ncbi:unnamed protein product [Protopolystoma xenopodis]|uniref:Uncharacterized protein n=1 Tax=Protopolystoma xenopodis TaxID=117903 RepID=A0A3S5CFT9_9PLAT|nr:unnamed protein product [Protopolystoma xenopodis]
MIFSGSKRAGFSKVVNLICYIVFTVCPSNRRKAEASDCNIQQDNGVYRYQEIQWNELVNCRCLTRSKRVLRLCYCRPPFKTTQCFENTNEVTRETRFVQVDNKCLPDQSAVTKEIRK